MTKAFDLVIRGGTLADAPKGTNTRLYGDADPMADATFPVKIDMLKEIDAFTRGLDRRVVQVALDQQQRPIEYSISYCRSDLYVFVCEE